MLMSRSGTGILGKERKIQGHLFVNMLECNSGSTHCLKISKDQKSVRGIKLDQKSVRGLKRAKTINAAPNCKRFKTNPYVLGCQEFSTERHFWEVTVGDRV
ncbi:hypothetical protein E2320_014552 [Naja naja]|nr:hypothetical protein E2320_014552 [Naja naja]